MEVIRDQCVVAGKSLAKGVNGRRPDIAEHNPDGADGELVQRPLAMTVSVAMRIGWRRAGFGVRSYGLVHGINVGLGRRP